MLVYLESPAIPCPFDGLALQSTFAADAYSMCNVGKIKRHLRRSTQTESTAQRRRPLIDIFIGKQHRCANHAARDSLICGSGCDFFSNWSPNQFTRPPDENLIRQ
jgi:hypothetical protein